MIVCNRDIIRRKGIFGVPDLVVEVLSPRTAKNDRGELYVYVLAFDGRCFLLFLLLSGTTLLPDKV